jgi:GABA(A) receptor-associated protein
MIDDPLFKIDCIMARHPTRVPCWIERCPNDKTTGEPVDGKQRYLIEKGMTVGQVMYIIRKRVKISEKKAIFLFIDGNTLPPNTAHIGELYKEHARPDRLLYLTYRSESTFG